MANEGILEVTPSIIRNGDGVYGAQAASGHFFGKDAARLILRTPSRLAAVLPQPARAQRPGSLGPMRSGAVRAIQRQHARVLARPRRSRFRWTDPLRAR